MRDWNNYLSWLLGLEQEAFLSYLWGIETHWILMELEKIIGFLSYLWGIETNIYVFIMWTP